MKSDFALAKEELKKIGIFRISSDFYQTPRRKGSVFFVRSPAGTDRTASLALYPSSNRFTDFSNANCSGDIIGFVAYVKGCNNWQALKELQSFYGLTDSREQDRQEVQRRIQLQKEREHRVAERKAEFRAALSGCIEDLKAWANIYRIAMEKTVFEPFTDEWCYCLEELQKTEYKMNILCAADCREYARLKPYHENLPSDRYAWILDCLDILQECRAFTATRAEIEEITAQRDFELTRQPGTERRCGVEW